MMLIIAAGVSAHSVPGLVDADARVTLKFYGIGVWVLFLGFNDSENMVANGKRGCPINYNFFSARISHYTFFLFFRLFFSLYIDRFALP